MAVKKDNKGTRSVVGIVVFAILGVTLGTYLVTQGNKLSGASSFYIAAANFSIFIVVFMVAGKIVNYIYDNLNKN
jgi:high-affinity Fe2+/Pb2+ permease